MCFKVFHSSLEIISQRETDRADPKRMHLTYRTLSPCIFLIPWSRGWRHSRTVASVGRSASSWCLCCFSCAFYIIVYAWFAFIVCVWVCGAVRTTTRRITLLSPARHPVSALFSSPTNSVGILQIPNQLNLTTGVKNTRHTNQRKIFPAVSFTTGNITIDALFYTPNF